MKANTITHLLVDYGEVLSQPQPAGVLEELARISGFPAEQLGRQYWRYRPDYDCGQASEDYWSTVLGRRLASDEPRLQNLIATDVRGWLHLNSPTLRVLFDFARQGTQLALLSNAPHPQADAVDRFSWAGLFTHRVYSCRIGIAKPEPSVFEQALAIIGAAPEHTLFIDDRASNTRAAARLGLRTHTFSSPAGLASALDEHLPGKSPPTGPCRLPGVPGVRS